MSCSSLQIIMSDPLRVPTSFSPFFDEELCCMCGRNDAILQQFWMDGKFTVEVQGLDKGVGG